MLPNSVNQIIKDLLTPRFFNYGLGYSIDFLAQNRSREEHCNLHIDDGGWLPFESPGDAMRYFKENRMSGEVKPCPFCKPLDHLRFQPLAKINVESVDKKNMQKSGEMTVIDTKSMWKKLTRKFSGLEEEK